MDSKVYHDDSQTWIFVRFSLNFMFKAVLSLPVNVTLVIHTHFCYFYCILGPCGQYHHEPQQDPTTLCQYQWVPVYMIR